MMMSEADYIALCEEHVRKLGMQVSREQIKAHYSQIKAQFMGTMTALEQYRLRVRC